MFECIRNNKGLVAFMDIASLKTFFCRGIIRHASLFVNISIRGRRSVTGRFKGYPWKGCPNPEPENRRVQEGSDKKRVAASMLTSASSL
jgi:hypothetical protein